jgi:hypothetical protein
MKSSEYRSKDGGSWIHFQPNEDHDTYTQPMYKHWNIHLSDFLSITLDCPGFKVISTKGKIYNLFQNFDPLDHYVATAMKNWNYDIYDQIRGFNKLARPERMFYTLLKYCRKVNTRTKAFSNPKKRRAYQSALDDLHNLFSPAGSFNPLPYDDMTRNLPENTSAGYEYLGKKKHQVKNQALRVARQRRQLLRYGHWDLVPYKFAMRGHLSPVDQNKSRPVWVTPYTTVILENYMFRNIYDFMFNNEKFKNLILTGKSTISRLREYLGSDSDSWFTNTDFSSWDSFRSRFVLEDTLRVIKRFFVFDDPVDSDLYDRLTDDFCGGAVALPNGFILQRAAGIPTGTLLTLLMNSMANFVVQSTIKYLMGAEGQHFDERIVGDDYAFKSFYPPDIEKMSFYAKKIFNMELHPDKCIVVPPENTEDRSFIGYKLRLNRLDKGELDIFKHCLYPESHVNSANVAFTRLFSYYVLGGVSQPSFVSFFEYFIGGYERVLKQKKGGVLDLRIMHQGNLRVFKHVFRLDFDYMSQMSLDQFLKLNHSHIPYHLTYDMPLI